MPCTTPSCTACHDSDAGQVHSKQRNRRHTRSRTTVRGFCRIGAECRETREVRPSYLLGSCPLRQHRWRTPMGIRHGQGSVTATAQLWDGSRAYQRSSASRAFHSSEGGTERSCAAVRSASKKALDSSTTLRTRRRSLSVQMERRSKSRRHTAAATASA